MPGYVRWSRLAFNVVAWLFVVCVGVQVYLAGLAVFQTGSFETHAFFGDLFGLLTLVLIALAVVGRLSRRLVGTTVLLLLLFIVQTTLAFLHGSNPTIAALHPLNGFLIGLVAIAMAWATRDYLRLARAAAP
jgi:putative tricarboxylic transport membrane protein